MFQNSFARTVCLTLSVALLTPLNPYARAVVNSPSSALEFGQKYASNYQLLDEIALVINDEAMSYQQLQQELARERAQFGDMEGISTQMLQTQLLERVIMQHLLAQIQQKVGIQASEQDIEAALMQVAEQNGLSVDELLVKVQQETGLDERAFRAQMAHEVVLQQLRQGLVGQNVRISEAQIDQQLAQIARAQGLRLQVQDLLVPVPAGGVKERGEAVKQILSTIANAHQAGQSLAQIASQINGATFNDLGEVSMAQIPNRFANAIANLPAGEIVESPITDRDGMHFLKVVSKQGEGGAYQLPEANVAHILLRVDNETQANSQKQRADALYQQLLAGADFSVLAQTYSDDRVSASQGGQLGWIGADEVVPAFAEAMMQAIPNQYTAPVRTPYGWHILKVLDQRIVDRSEEVLRAQIRQSLLEKQLEEVWQQRLLELRQQAYVDIRL